MDLHKGTNCPGDSSYLHTFIRSFSYYLHLFKKTDDRLQKSMYNNYGGFCNVCVTKMYCNSSIKEGRGKTEVQDGKVCTQPVKWHNTSKGRLCYAKGVSFKP